MFESNVLNIIDPIFNRRSHRKFDSRPVEREKIISCLDAARLAPSAENCQPWRFVIIDDPEFRDEFHREVFRGIYSPTRWAEQAPLLLALVADSSFITHQMAGRLQHIPFHLNDTAIAGEHFILQAEALELVTCWIGWFHVKRAARLLKIPRSCTMCSLIAVGYPHPDHRPRKRRLMERDKLVYHNRWGRAYYDRNIEL